VSLAAAIAFGLGGQGVARQIVQDGYEKSDEVRQQIQQQQQNQQEQSEQQSDSSESAEVDGQKLEAPRLRREY
jgi:O-acetyl-ADP-ribose deacetylase (regulator of RNase III)